MIPFLQSHSGLTSRVSTIFANGEPGVWFDPSDFSTLYQDSAGTTPVTAVEQPVGLMLDKSKGLVLGPELVTNGTFDTGISGWVATQGAEVTWLNGSMSVRRTASDTRQAAHQVITCEIGKTYRLRLSAVGQTVSIKINDLDSPIFGAVALSTTSFSNEYIFVATATSQYIHLSPNNVSTTLFDNISVRELPGNHAFQATATSRPVLRQDGNGKHYLYFDGVDDFLVTPTITPGIDKVQVFAGVRRLRNVTEIIAETGVDFTSLGAFFLATEATNNRYGYAGRGSRVAFADDQASINFFPPPDTAILTATQAINGNTPAQMRRNGVLRANSRNTTFGGGNFLAYPLYIGRRAGTSFPFNGHLYSLIVRFGANLPIETIEETEKYINGLTKAY